jgi:hypothetical protein
MPRKPVKEVIEHRITLGTLERSLARDLVLSMQIKNVATPAVSLMKDVTGMIVLVGIMNELFGLNVELAGVTDIDELMGAVKSAIKQAEILKSELGETPDNPVNRRLGILGRVFEGIGDIQRFILTGSPDGMEAEGNFLYDN